MLTSGSILVLVILVFGIVVLLSTIKIVPQGYNYTVENFGRYTRTLTPGRDYHLLWVIRPLPSDFV